MRTALEEYKTIFMASRNFADRTRVEYLNDLLDLIQFLEESGLRDVKDISIPKLERYLAELDHRGMAGSTRKRKVISIRSFLLYLYHDGYLRTNLSNQLIPPFSEASSLRYLTKSECERLLEVSSYNTRDYALIQLLLDTGIKLSELVALTVQDIELSFCFYPKTQNVGSLHVLGNNRRKGRIIPLNVHVSKSITKYFKGRNNPQHLALFTNKYGAPLGPRGAEKIVSKYMLKAGIKNASIQTLRHTYAVHSLLSGVDLKTIRYVMGFRDVRAISIYNSFTKAVLYNNRYGSRLKKP